MKESSFGPLKEKSSTLHVEKENSKKILSNLTYLIEAGVLKKNEDIFLERIDSLADKITTVIGELKANNFERGLENYSRINLSWQLLSQTETGQELGVEIEKEATELYSKIEPHLQTYGTSPDEICQKNLLLISDELKSLENEIETQKIAIEKLQELLFADDEFKEIYIEPLNEATDKLELLLSSKNSLCLTQAVEAIKGTSLEKIYLSKIEDLVLDQKNQELQAELDSVVLQWEVLPTGTRDAMGSNGTSLQNETREQRIQILHEERLAMLESLNPLEIYISKDSALETSGRKQKKEYHAYVFEKVVVMVSPWTENSVYIIPKLENWQALTRESKDFLSSIGAIKMNHQGNLKERISEVLSSNPFVHFEEEIKGMDRWIENKEKFFQVARRYILSAFPEVDLALKADDLEKAKDLISNIKYANIEKRIYVLLRKHSPNLFEFFSETFPEIDLDPKDFQFNATSQRYRWAGKSLEEKTANIKDAIFSAYPEIKDALENGDLENAREWFDQMRDDDFEAIGLKCITDGKIKDIGTKNVAIRLLLPGYRENGTARGHHYKNEQERKSAWGTKFREAVLEKFPAVENLLNTKDQEGSGAQIISIIKDDGGIDKFIRENVNSIRGTGKLFSGYRDMLQASFPELNWSGIEKFPHKIFHYEGSSMPLGDLPFAYKDLLIKKVSGLQTALDQEDNALAKILITQYLQKEEPRKFCADNFPGVSSHHFESQVKLLRKAFPEMEWPGSTLSLGKKKGKRKK